MTSLVVSLSARVVPVRLVTKDTREQLGCQDPGGSPAKLVIQVDQEPKATRDPLGPPDPLGTLECPDQLVTPEARDQLDWVEHL